MRAVWTLLILAIAVSFALSDDDFIPPEDSDVVRLTDKTFTELTGDGTWLIDFYAPWCGHCKKLAPVWEQVATSLHGKINVASVDCTEHPILQGRFQIKGFPTIMILREGEHRMYKGDRSIDALVKYGNLLSQPPVEYVGLKDVSKLLKDHPHQFFFLGDKGTASRVYEDVAFQLQGVLHFAGEETSLSTQERNKIREKLDVVGLEIQRLDDVDEDLTFPPFLTIISKGLEREVFAGPWSRLALREWIENRKLPLVSEISGSNFDDVTKSGKLAAMAATDPSSPLTPSYLQKLHELAKRHRDRFVMANIDAVAFFEYVDRFGLASSTPTLFVLDALNEFYWVHPDKQVREDQMDQFLRDVISGVIPGVNVYPWYSPTRYTNWVSRNLSETQIIILVTVSMLLFGVFMMVACYYGLSDMAPTPPSSPHFAARPGNPAGIRDISSLDGTQLDEPSNLPAPIKKRTTTKKD